MFRAKHTYLMVGIAAALLSVAMAFAAAPALAGAGSMHGTTANGGVTFKDAGDPAHAQSGNMLITSLSGLGSGGNVRFNGTLSNNSTSTNDTFTEVRLACQQGCSGTGSLVVNVGPGSTHSFIFAADGCNPAETNAAFSIGTTEQDGTLNSVMAFFKCP